MNDIKLEITNSEYRKLPQVSKSDLMKITVSPKYFKYCMDHPEENKKTHDLTFGSAAHKWILEKDDFFNEFIVEEKFDKRTSEGKRLAEEFEIRKGNKEVISQEDFETIKAMAEELLKNKWARTLLKGEHEKSFVWEDKETGEGCKCRPDCLCEFKGQHIIVDYKTTRDPEKNAFQKSIEKYGYDLQAGMYTEGMKANTGHDYQFVFIAQEKKPPYDFNIFQCDEEMMTSGKNLFHILIKKLHECKTTGKWNGVMEDENKLTSLGLPPWAKGVGVPSDDEESEDFE